MWKIMSFLLRDTLYFKSKERIEQAIVAVSTEPLKAV